MLVSFTALQGAAVSKRLVGLVLESLGPARWPATVCKQVWQRGAVRRGVLFGGGRFNNFFHLVQNVVTARRSEHFSFCFQRGPNQAESEGPCLSLFLFGGSFYNLARTASCNPHNRMWGFRSAL